ncbi:outer dynein arm-docking complex subunit 4-like [Neodiprion pinetum]|uniref:outer dynein arm-docking complex subunit 4-like n=1 Tax=Neodiprion pinetum TaxID=441929 RepID=UPI001EDF3CFD|nr:outer dynein arm-docking complex subunit 4-like [Neodiprion pinetum]
MPTSGKTPNPGAGSSTKDILGAPVLYREWGYRFTRLEEYPYAIKAFNASQAHAEASDLRTLLGLSVALSRHTKYHEAAEVIDKCMEIDPQNLRVKWRRVETLFEIAEFGYSLIHAHQGMQQHEFPFELGVFQGNETVLDCIGRNTSPIALRELFPWIQRVQKRQMELIAKLGEEEDEFAAIDDENTRLKVNDPVAKLEAYLRQLHRVLAETYLGLMAHDKDTMEKTLNSSAVWSANAKSSKEIYALAEESYQKSCYRQDVLRIRKPYYTRRFNRKAWPLGHKRNVLHLKQIRRDNIIIEADFLLLRLHAARMKRDYPLFFQYLDRAKDKFESYSNRMFPFKQKCLNTIYKMAAWAYIDPRNLTCLEGETKIRYLKHHLGIRVAKLPRDSDLGWVPTTNIKHALKVFRHRLSLASEPLELAWLFHDLCKLNFETLRFDLARFYAKKARDASANAKNEHWALNANHILLRIEVVQHNRNEAREAAQVAMLNAKRLGIDYLVDFYQNAIWLVDEIDFESRNGVDSIIKRQMLIVDLMPEELKNRVDFLFRSMNVVPARRRLSVMPGCKAFNYKFPMPCRRNSIFPAPPRDPEKEARNALLQQYAPTRGALGWVDFEDY